MVRECLHGIYAGIKRRVSRLEQEALLGLMKNTRTGIYPAGRERKFGGFLVLS